MPTISDLNVRLGLLTTEFDKNLAKVERSMQRSADRLSRLGNDLTIAVSAPLAIFGGSAIKAAGEIESLRLAMESTFAGAGRSITDANAELEALRQAALAPGLDFEQAVRGSIRLQNVGFAAEEARGILIQLANAVATTGGTAIELDGVTRQFTQMIAKGRVMQEDLTIIQENMPLISKAMEDAFGTRSADRLREMGVTAEQFIVGVTKQLETLPRVQGGISNALVNLTSGVRNQMARLGETINRTFNIDNVADRLIGALTKVIDYFDSLEDSSKRAIVQFALVAIAAGPVVKVMGVLYGVGAQAVGIFRSIATSGPAIVAFFKSMQAGSIGAVGGIGRLITAFRALDLATKATAIGAVIGVVVALGAAVYTLTNRTTEAVAAQKALSEVQKSAAESAAQEAAKAGELVRAFTKENASREDKRRAIEALKQINPEYFGQLDAEKSTTEDVTAALKAYTKELIRAATVKQAVDKIAEIKTNLADLSDEAELTGLQTGFIATKAAITNLLNPLAAVNSAIKDAKDQTVKNAEEAAKAYDAQIKALEQLIDQNLPGAELERAKKLAEAFSKENASRAEKKKAIEGLKDISEQYFGALSAEKSATTDVTNALNAYANQQERIAKSKDKTGSFPDDSAKKMASALASVNANLNAYEERIKLAGEGSRNTDAEIKLLSTSIDKLLRAGFSSASPEVERLNEKLETAKDASAKLREEWEALKKFFERPATPTLPTVQPGPDGPQAPTADTENVQGGAFGIVAPDAQGFRDTAQGVRDFTASIQESIEPLTTAQIIMNGLRDGTLSFSEAYQQAVERIAESGTVVQNVALAIGGAMQQAANEGASSFKQLASAALAGAAKVARAYIIEGVSSVVASALKTVPFPFNLAVGAAAGAAAGALFNKAIGAIGIPALAGGGVISGPTLALLGEYPGAGSNPEIAAPESKLRNIFREEGGGRTEVYGIIRGEDILISTERAAANRRRVR